MKMLQQNKRDSGRTVGASCW